MVKGKKALSIIVSTLILILLTIVAITIIWNVVGKVIGEKIDKTESCYDIFEKVSINNEYTCYNTTNNYVQFSINIGDINIDSLMVSIQGGGSSQSIQITNELQQIPYLANYLSEGFGNDYIVLPSKNGGLTYVYYQSGFFTTIPDSIKIAPIIGDNQCNILDSINSIGVCS